MKNKKLQSPTDQEVFRAIAEEIVDWQIKNEFLKKQIDALGKVKNLPIFQISSYLLKTQLIEFELKQLITGLDQHLFFSSRSKVLKLQTRTPKDLDEKRMTLGDLKEEIKRFEGSILKELQATLPKLVKLRNEFVHQLFKPGSIKELNQKSEEGLKLADEVIVYIEKIDKFLKKNDPLKN